MTQLSVTQTRSIERHAWAGAVARALPAAVLVALAVGEAWHARGSIAAADWLGYAVVAGLVLAVVAASGVGRLPPLRVGIAVGALVGLAAWDALSLRWSASPSLARDEALLTVLYAVALLVPAVSAQTVVDRTVAAAAVTALLGGAAVGAALEVATAGSAGEVFFARRLDFPVSYPNAEAAFALVALWPALALAADWALPVVVRAFALAAASASAACWAMAESKGGALGILVSTLVVFAVTRRRLRLLVPAAIVALVTAAGFAPLTDPYRTEGLATLHRAGATAVGLAAASLVLGAVYALVDRRVNPSDGFTRTAGRAVLVCLLAVVVAGAAVAIFRVDFGAQWRSFKHLPTRDRASSHFVSLGSNRYDFWRVALSEFGGHPIAGIGSRGFRAAYLQHRRSNESPARAHSVEMDALSETGFVGFALLVVAVGFCIAAFGRRARDDLVALGALGAFAGWLAHSSVDWIWSFPAIGVPVFVLAGNAAAYGTFRLPRRAALPLAAAAAALAIGGFGVPWLASHYVRAALRGGPAATDDLSRARTLDPLSVDPLLAEAALASTARAAVPPLVEAVRMQPRSPDLLYALGIARQRAGDRAAARSALRHALRLDPDDPAILDALRH